MQTFELTRATGALFLGMLLAGAADAATTYTIDESLDLTTPMSSGTGYAFYSDFGSMPTVSIAVGDTLDYTVQFLTGQSLSLQNVQYLWGFLKTLDTATKVTATGQLDLLDASGNVLLASNEKTDSEGVSHFGQSFVSADFVGGLPSVVTFSGIRYVGTVDSYENGSTSRDYFSTGFAYLALPAATPVPEPASVALLLAGLGMSGVAMRRRRARAEHGPRRLFSGLYLPDQTSAVESEHR